MFRRARRRTIEWGRVAQFEPIRVEGAPVAQEEANDRPSGTVAIQAGMRVALRRDLENPHDLNTVAVDSLDERTLGYLPADVTAWVAPLLDSGRIAFDGRIYAVEPADPQATTGATNFYLALTQFGLMRVERFSLVIAIRELLRLPAACANWCFGSVAALHHAFTRSRVPPPDRYAADDSSSS